MIKKVFGAKLKQLRKENELTQQSLAEKSGLALRYVQEIESGDKQPTVSTLFKLSSALKLTPGELLDTTFKKWERQGKPQD